MDARLTQSDYTFPSRRAPALARLPFEMNGAPATLYHRFAGHGSRDWRAEQEGHDLTLGVEGGLLAGIGFDAHLRSYRHDEHREAGTFVHRSGIHQALRGAGAGRPFPGL